MELFDNNEAHRGYEQQLNFNDAFLTTWICLWMLPTTIVFILMIKHRICSSSTTPSTELKRDKNDTKIWILGFMVCLFLYFREIASVTSWITFVITFDYSATSASFIADIALYTSWMFADVSLYSFFIYRLYIVYNPNNQNMFTIKLYWYVLLATLNVLNLVSCSVIVIAWIVFDDKLFVMGHSLCLGLEIIMYIILVTLFSKPMLSITANLTPSGSEQHVGRRREDKVVILLTRMNILSSVALLTIIFKRIFDISAFMYCPDECWLTYISYSLLPIDSFTNMFCILCSFPAGTKHYHRWCKCIHNFVMAKCIGVIVMDQSEDSERTSGTMTSNETTGPRTTINSPSKLISLANTNTSFHHNINMDNSKN